MVVDLAANRNLMEVDVVSHSNELSNPVEPGAPESSTDDPVAPATAPRRLETGRYSQEFKAEVVRQVQSGRKGVAVAAQYGLCAMTVYRWNKAAKNAGGEVPPTNSTRPESSGPSPIDEEHRGLVLALKEKYPNMGLAQVQNQVRRFHAVKLSRPMIGRIFREAGIPLEKKIAATKGDPRDNRFEMTRPNELWAVDFKEFWIHSEKAYGLFLLDDFSRFCVGFAVTRKATAELAIETVGKAIQRYGRPERMLSDRGPQFHAWNGVSRFDEFLADFLIDHSVTKANHCFTNGKIEAFNRNLDVDVLDVEEFASVEEVESAISAYVSRYNFTRTHMGIEGLVPADRYFGMLEEARKSLEHGLEKCGPKLGWLHGLISVDGRGLRVPTVLQLVVRDGKLEVVVLGRRFTIG